MMSCKVLSFVSVYLYDILIFSKTSEEHVKHVTTVVDKIMSNNLLIRWDHRWLMFRLQWYRTSICSLRLLLMHMIKHWEQDSFSKVSLWLMQQISCTVPITLLTKMLAVENALKFLCCYLEGKNFTVLKYYTFLLNSRSSFLSFVISLIISLIMSLIIIISLIISGIWCQVLITQLIH